MGLFSFFRRSQPSTLPDDDATGASGGSGSDPSVFDEETTEVESHPVAVDRPASGSQNDTLRWGVYSITGNFRDNNEDSVGVDDRGRFFLVADGMGGQTAGEKASELAVQVVSRELDAIAGQQPVESLGERLRQIVGQANSEIVEFGSNNAAYNGMGTTLVSIVRATDAEQPDDAEAWVVGSIGDSRVYRLRDGELEQITVDHSLTQALIDAGTITPEEAKVHRYKNMLVKYLGAKEGADGGESFPLDLRPGDRVCLCSDGVTDGLEDETLAKLMRHDPIEATRAIVKAAQDGGSRDNISCIVLERIAGE